jgi:hypothetical protein
VPLITCKGLKNLAFELFLALQILRVSRYLPSSDRRGTLLRDLARLIRSVDDTDDFDVKSVVPLLEQVVKHMRPMKIYGGAVFTLVARRATPSAVFNKAAFETPLKSTSSSQQGDEQIHDEIDPRILQENNGWVYQNTRGFYEKYLEGRTWSTVVEKIVRAVNPRIVDGRWTEYQNPPSQKAFLEWFWTFQARFL